MVLLEAYDDWSNVATEDGYVGWVSNKTLYDAETETPEARHLMNRSIPASTRIIRSIWVGIR